MACLEHARKMFLETLDGGHDANVISNLEVVAARPGSVRTRMKIQPRHLNGHGNVHGGCIMTMVDCITWIALATLGAPCIHTVSSNMSAEFLRPAGTEGEYLYCEGTASKVGRRMAFTRIDFRNEKGQLVAFGSHTHAVLPETRPHEVVFSDDGETAIPVAQGKL